MEATVTAILLIGALWLFREVRGAEEKLKDVLEDNAALIAKHELDMAILTKKGNKMAQKHKHHDAIVAWAAGLDIQRRSFMTNYEWADLEDGGEPCFNGSTEWRIKPEPPEKVYPVTRLTTEELYEIWKRPALPIGALTNVANAALRHAIDWCQVAPVVEGKVKIYYSGFAAKHRDARDMAIAKAVRDWYVSDKDDAQLARLIANVKD